MSKKCRPSSSQPCRIGITAQSNSRGPFVPHSSRVVANPRMKQQGFGLGHRHPLAAIWRLYPYRLITGHRQHVGVLWVSSHRLAGPDCRHTRYQRLPSRRECVLPRALDHLSGQLTFGVKERSLWNASLPAPLRIVDPLLGQIQFAIDERVSF